MAEVLSQSQIDALIHSANNEEGLDVESFQKGIEKGIRKYDFHSPKKFTKDRLKLVRTVHENFARFVASRLNSLLRINSEVEVVAVEEQRFYEFSNALVDKDVLTLVDTKLIGNSENAPVILQITPQLMLSMIDRRLGGTGENVVSVSSSYSYTDIELSLYENIMKYFISVMKDGWSNYVDINFDFHRIETAPGMMQEIGMDEIIMIVILEVTLQDIKGKINICIPGTLLTDIFAIFDSKKGGLTKTIGNGEKTAQEILGSIKNSPMEIKAELGEAQVTLNDIFNLQVGDVINLNKPKDAEVYLYVEDKPWFKGKLGVKDKKMAVKISETLEVL